MDSRTLAAANGWRVTKSVADSLTYLLSFEPGSAGGDAMEFNQWKRRDFVMLLCGAAPVWPLAAGAPQPRTARIDFLDAANAAGTPSWMSAGVLAR